jgi:hypothetical protein
MVYANLFIIYTTPTIKISMYHASYATTTRHATLTANECENPRPKHGRACLLPRIFLDAISLRFLFDCCVLAAYFLPSFLHYTVVVKVELGFILFSDGVRFS